MLLICPRFRSDKVYNNIQELHLSFQNPARQLSIQGEVILLKFEL